MAIDPETGEEIEIYENVAEDFSGNYAGSDLGEGGVMPPPDEGDDDPIPSAEAESSALSDAKNRGEDVLSTALKNAEEETIKKKLPTLSEAIPLVPLPIQEALDEIFRAKWTRVTRIKKRELYQP